MNIEQGIMNIEVKLGYKAIPASSFNIGHSIFNII